MPSNIVRVSDMNFVRVVASSIDFAIEVIPSPALTECQDYNSLVFASLLFVPRYVIQSDMPIVVLNTIRVHEHR